MTASGITVRERVSRGSAYDCISPASAGDLFFRPTAKRRDSRYQSIIAASRRLPINAVRIKKALARDFFAGAATHLLAVLSTPRRIALLHVLFVGDRGGLHVRRRNMAALPRIAIEQRSRFPRRIRRGSRLLSKVDGIMDAAVHAHGADRAVEMGGIAGQQHSALAETSQRPADPPHMNHKMRFRNPAARGLKSLQLALRGLQRSPRLRAARPAAPARSAGKCRADRARKS